MKGVIELNSEASYMGFKANGSPRRLHYCPKERIAELLIDLELIPADKDLTKYELTVHLNGEFPAAILSKYGLIKKFKHGHNF